VHLAFLGLGQIGGSIARAAAEGGFATRISAWTPGGTGPDAARADGVDAAATAAEAIEGADLIVLAAPPQACLDLLDGLAGSWSAGLAPDAVITDVASTKAAITARARDLGLRFVGSHPMAGREASGYAAADAGLFRDRPWVIVPATPPDPAAEARVHALVAACGGRPLTMTAEEHDAAVAAISHLPLVVSAALVEAMTRAPGWPAAAALAAGGWASMTRLARGDAAMGAGIVATNRAAIAARLRELRAVLDEWLRLVDDASPDAPDPAVVERRLAAARAALAEGDVVATDAIPTGTPGA